MPKFLHRLHVPKYFIDQVDRPLKSTEIQRAIPGIKVVPYTDLHKYDDLSDLLGDLGAVVLLYMSAKRFGHYVLLMRREDDNTIEFFDSYGSFPDENLDKIKYTEKIQSNEIRPLILLLLADGYKTVDYSDTRLQNKDRHIQTCGRWVIVRWLLRSMKLKDFIRIFDMMDFKIRDLMVTMITLAI